ncbi:MAG: abortive infection family protein [Deltaproteobacteria bacterium]|nr:abortive infection family protein [Deltaproteobacteria bacterium]
MAAPAPAAPFVMHGSREAFAAGLTHIEEQVRSIEQAVVENPALAFDLARTLVETACRTILGERKVAFSEDDDLPRLFKTASNHLPFLPLTASGEAATGDSLRRTLSGLSTAIQGICELRNQCGFASHGSDKPRPAMESVQALMAAEAADTIVGFLHRVHRQDRTPLPSPRSLYDEHEAFNDSVDEAHGPVRIFEIEFRASEVLFQMEPESYRIYAAEFDENSEDAEVGAVAPSEAAP